MESPCPRTTPHASMWPVLLSVLTTTSAVQHRMPEYNRSELSIMIPEPRPLTSLPLVALQAHTHFPELQVQILHGLANEEFVYQEKTLKNLRNKGVLVLTRLPSNFFQGNLSTDRYSSMLKAPDFWSSALTPKILLAQTDTWLCNSAHASIRPFLPYDYVGAPWGHLVADCPDKGGNGGFSLRDREAMLRVTRRPLQSLNDLLLPEDVFFCNHASLKLPPRQLARHFAREEKIEQSNENAAESLVGVHKLVTGDSNGFTKEEALTFFEDRCPGVSLMVQAMGRLDTSFGWKESDNLVQKWMREVRQRLILSQRPSQGLAALNLRLLSSAGIGG